MKGVPGNDPAYQRPAPWWEGFIDAEGDPDGLALLHGRGGLDARQTDDGQGLSGQAAVGPDLEREGRHREQDQEGQPVGLGELQDIQQ